ncbi:hypothetical protein [Ralstonia sp. 25mfcol4.1]|uniref:hypothetical protein n=1 Tax=Ralstonia sp. 25mfcol4.1 TaxID=1761899 RepID=UPI000B80B850|nr:hypothetical protein [Ralstonia sp. 25mfcol4.1]
MSDADNQRALLEEARRLAENVDGTADQLLALAHAGYRTWTRNRRLHFPESRRHALLLEILRYCAASHLLECPPFEQSRVAVVEDAMDASYPRYARLHRAPSGWRVPLHLQAVGGAKRR